MPTSLELEVASELCYGGPMIGEPRGWLFMAGLMLFSACASPPAARVNPLFKDGVRQRPMTPEEAERILQTSVPEIEVCYRREMLNLTEKMSSYLFQVSIPTDASPPNVLTLDETVPNQENLRSCLIETIRRVPFPAHTGQPITLRVPIEGPG